ncbi:MAG: helix-turn-helix domain-containing protein [Gordonia sp. (in: high G+C Gram-positive bacteria)]
MRSEEVKKRTFADEARRGQLVDCAIELIAERGYPQTSLAKIAERAGVAKSVVLYHFTNKDELVAAIVGAVFTASAGVIIPALAGAATSVGRLAAYVDAHRDFLRDHGTAAMALYDISTSYRSADGLRFDQLVQADVDAAGVPPEFAQLDPQGIIESGLATGEFVTTMPPRLIADALRAALDGAVANLARVPLFDVSGYLDVVKHTFLSALEA